MKRFLSLAVTAFAIHQSHAAPWSLSVVDEKGAPVANARVRIWPNWGEKIEPLQTDVAGKAVGDLAPRWFGLGRVFIYAPGHAPAGGILTQGENKVRLRAPRTISGRVVDEAGKPLPNVEVAIQNVFAPRTGERTTLENSVDFFLEQKERAFFSTRTDAQGRYQIVDLPTSGTAQISVREDSWYSRAVGIDLADETLAPDIKAQPAARLSGRVLRPDGTPAANVTVHSLNHLGSAETDAEGRYRLGGVPAGKAQIRLAGNPRTDEFVGPRVDVTAVTGVETPVPDIRLSSGAIIELKMVPAASDGLFTLRLKGAPLHEGSYDVSPRDGTTRARVEAGSYRLEIAQPPRGWATPADWPKDGLEIKAVEGETRKVEIRLDPALEVSGVAHDEAGKPLAGVVFHEPFDDDAKVVSDAQGRFVLRGFAPGETTLTVGDEWEIVAPKKVKLPLAQPLVVTLRKRVVAPLRGRVIDDKGAPVADARVAVNWQVPISNQEGFFRITTRHTRTDAEGRYEVASVLVSQRPTVVVTKPKHRVLSGGDLWIAATIPAINGTQIPNPNAVFTATDIVLQPLVREVSGRVVDTGGRPVANALVAALAGGMEGVAVPRNISRTDADGRFLLADLPEGEIGFVAGANTGFAEVRSNSTVLDDLVLQPQAKSQRDVAKARELILQLIDDTRGSNYFIRGVLAGTFVPADYELALEAEAALHPDDKDLAQRERTILSLMVTANPQAVRDKLPTWLAQWKKEQDKPNVMVPDMALRLSRMLAQPQHTEVAGENETDAAIRAFIHSSFQTMHAYLVKLDIDKQSDLNTAYEFALTAALAARLEKPAANALAQSAIAIGVRHANAEQEDRGSVEAVAEGVAEGGAPLLEAVFDAIPAQRRAGVLGRAVPVIARQDMAGALRLVEKIPAQEKPEGSYASNSEPEYAFGLAAKAVIARMSPKDAAAALALARRVTDSSHRAEALALAAQRQPAAENASLFREAFALATEGRGDRQEARIAALALGTNTAVGAELLAKIETSFFSDAVREGDTVSHPAFYLARVEPGRARVWLEWRWAQAQTEINGINGPHELTGIAMAMSGVDTRRALEMAASIPPKREADGKEDFNVRWEAQRKIAQFLVASDKVRDTLRFDRWNAGDTWTPGDDTGW
jgi:hypothetical protein